VGVEEGTPGGESGEVEKVLLGTDVAVVPLGQLLLLLYVLVQLSLLRERNGVDALQVVVLLLSQPVSR
jgi:hypothetical protein